MRTFAFTANHSDSKQRQTTSFLFCLHPPPLSSWLSIFIASLIHQLSSSTPLFSTTESNTQLILKLNNVAQSQTSKICFLFILSFLSTLMREKPSLSSLLFKKSCHFRTLQNSFFPPISSPAGFLSFFSPFPLSFRILNIKINRSAEKE